MGVNRSYHEYCVNPDDKISEKIMSDEIFSKIEKRKLFFILFAPTITSQSGY